MNSNPWRVLSSKYHTSMWTGALAEAGEAGLGMGGGRVLEEWWTGELGGWRAGKLEGWAAGLQEDGEDGTASQEIAGFPPPRGESQGKESRLWARSCWKTCSESQEYPFVSRNQSGGQLHRAFIHKVSPLPRPRVKEAPRRRARQTGFLRVCTPSSAPSAP